MPAGLLDPKECKATMWTAAKASQINGKVKWNAKNLVRVAEDTPYPPHMNSAIKMPKPGIAVSILVITVAAQKLI